MAKELNQSEVTSLNSLDEEWRNVIGYGEYASSHFLVSNHGRVKRRDGFIPNVSHDKDGYERVSLKVGEDKNYKTVKVHRLVCLAFIPNPQNKPCVDHIDSNRTNNNVENLRWATVQENNSTEAVKSHRRAHMKAHNIGYINGVHIWQGRHHSQETKDKMREKKMGKKLSPEVVEKMRARMTGTRNVSCFKPVLQYSLDGKFIKRWACIRDAVESIPNAVGVGIYKCVRGYHKTAYGYVWVYES